MKITNNISALKKRTIRVKSVWRYLPEGIYHNPFCPDESESKEQKETLEINKSSSNIVDTCETNPESTIEKVVNTKEISLVPVISLFAKAKRDGVKNDMDNDMDSTLEFASNNDINTLNIERSEYSVLEGETMYSSQSVSRLDSLLTRIIDDPKLDSFGKMIMRRKLSLAQVIHLTEGELRILGIKDYVTLKLILKFLEEMRGSRDDPIQPTPPEFEMNFVDEPIVVMNTLEDAFRGLKINDDENSCEENSNSSNLSEMDETLPFTPNDESILDSCFSNSTQNDKLNHTTPFHILNQDETSDMTFSEYSPINNRKMTSLLKPDCYESSENSCVEIKKPNADIEKHMYEIELGSLSDDTSDEQPPVIVNSYIGKSEKMTSLNNISQFESDSLNWKNATALATAFVTGMITTIVLSRK